MDTMLIVMLGVFGALFGSFAGAQVWRLRARQLREDKRDYEVRTQAGEKVKRRDYYDSHELDALQPLLKSVTDDRSQCLSCGHQLAWYDLVPILSWLSLRGRCRYCKARIGFSELGIELGLAAVFVLSFMRWPYVINSTIHIAAFSLWLIACVVMAILLLYDVRWSLLPFALNILLIVIAVIFRCLVPLGSEGIGSLVGGIAILGGLYGLFALLGWAGVGDSILGVGLALLLGDWQLAFLALFLANLLGSLALIPLQMTRKLHRHMRIPFGPFMIIATIISMIWGVDLIHAFFGVSTGLFTTLML